MGKVFSSRKDYNRALAKQPRKSIGVDKIDTSDVQQEPLVGTLSIPYPVRISESTERISDSINQSSPVTNEFVQPPPNPSYYANHYQEQQLPRILSPPCSSSSSSQAMSSDPVIIRRSVINLNKHRRTNNSQLSSYTPRPLIVERNGKQFVSEVRERMERRYVQVYDEMSGQMRLFEVTDYIPTQTVRSVRNSSQLSVPNKTHRHSFTARHPSRTMHTDRTELTTPSNLVDFRDLNNRETVAREFDLYHSGADLPFANQNHNNVPPANAPHDSSDSSYADSRSQGYNSPIVPPPIGATPYSPGSYQSQARSFRQHSPTASDYSATTTTARSISDNSDMESINRALTPTNLRNKSTRNDSGVSYGTMTGQSSSTEPDPFAKTVRTGDHTYTQRSGVNNYSEPMQMQRGFPRTGNSDYAPLATAPTRANRDRRKDSNVYES